jgi:hypothetical protein
MVRQPSEDPIGDGLERRGFIMDSLNALAEAIRSQGTAQWEQAPLSEQRVTFEKFLKLDPPTFSSGVDPDAAEYWVSEIERVFEVLSVPDEKKTLFGSFRLKDEARIWWDTTRRMRFLGLSVVPWETFKKAFLDNYFPPHVREKKKIEFLELCQGNLTLSEYVAKFQQLERHCPNLFEDERERARKFIRGLKEGLRPRVLTNMPATFSTTVETTTFLNEDWERTKSTQPKRPPAAGGDRKKVQPRAQFKQPFLPVKIEESKQPVMPVKIEEAKQSGPPAKRQRNQYRPSPRQPSRGTCRRCGRSHVGQPCPRETGGCLYCGKMGHYIQDYRKKAADDLRQASGAP